MTSPRWKKPHKIGSIRYYIEKVFSDGAEYSYPPVVAELRLSLLMELKPVCRILRLLCGLLLGFLFALFLRLMVGGYPPPGQALKTI